MMSHDRSLSSSSSNPRVSIGLPVFNGEAFLADAIEAILAQSWRDLELIICDNGSFDRTAEIAQNYARRDSRVRYCRNVENLGAAANHNLCVELARGEYFKWAAHDDLIAAEFIERCVAALDARPDAVLCQSMVQMIDDAGRCLGTYDPGRLGTDAPRASTRFGIRIRQTWCKEVFGLIRSSALARTGLIRGFPDADRVLLAELALLGPFVTVAEPLFLNREHAARYSRSHIEHPRTDQTWYAPQTGHKRQMRTWQVYLAHFRSARRLSAGRAERWRCYLQLLAWPGVNWHLVNLAIDPIVAVEPRAHVAALRIKRRLLGRARWPARFEPMREEESR